MHTIGEVARTAGVTSRTLRHYDAIGLLPATDVAASGSRLYDDAALVRLQRILLLRDLGLDLPSIADVLARDTDEDDALRRHLAAMKEESERLRRRIAAVEQTLRKRREGEDLMIDDVFDGFDHTRHRDEVVERWGEDAYRASDAWWTGMTDAERADWRVVSARLAERWVSLATSGTDPASAEAQNAAARHVEWLRGIPGTPAADPDGDVAGYVRGLAEMYVADPRFAKNYAVGEGDTTGAAFVRDALLVYVRREP